MTDKLKDVLVGRWWIIVVVVLAGGVIAISHVFGPTLSPPAETHSVPSAVPAASSTSIPNQPSPSFSKQMLPTQEQITEYISMVYGVDESVSTASRLQQLESLTTSEQLQTIRADFESDHPNRRPGDSFKAIAGIPVVAYSDDTDQIDTIVSVSSLFSRRLTWINDGENWKVASDILVL